MTPRNRPRYPKPDENHSIIKDYVDEVQIYGGLPLRCMDISKLGGEFVDWIVFLGPLTIFCEVKTPEAYQKKDYNLTEGEKKFFKFNPAPKYIIANEQHISDMLHDHLDAAYILETELNKIKGRYK